MEFKYVIFNYVHHISNETEDMKLLKLIYVIIILCNFVLIWKLIKIVLDKLASRSGRLLVPLRDHTRRCERLLVAKGLKVI